MDRKSFLQLAGTGLAGALLPSDLAAFAPAMGRLSLQLYTVRDAVSQDLEGTIKKISDMGFAYVETAFWPEGTTLSDASTILNNAGLKVSSCHVEVPVGDHKQTFVRTGKAFDCKRMIWHGWPEDKRYSSLEGTKELAKLYNAAAAFARSEGLEFGLHNHWWEFRNRVGGKLAYEILLEETDPSIFFEIDTYWVKVAGLVPSTIIKQFGSRAKLLHIKDGPAVYSDKLASDDVDPMTAVGKGTQDIPSIIGAATYTDFFVVEMDKVNGDVFPIISESHSYLNSTFGLR